MYYTPALNPNDPNFHYGEKANFVCNWGNNFASSIMQFYFQLIRTSHPNPQLETQLTSLLRYTQINGKRCRDTWILLYRLIGYTRDKRHGRGEYQLAYMQLFVWYNFYPELAIFAFMHFVNFSKYGSWKDIKLFSEYIYRRTLNIKHPFIELMVFLLVQQLKEDELTYKKGGRISKAAKWTPREKSKYSWLFKKIALNFSPHLFCTAKTETAAKSAQIKANMLLRRFLSKMNKYTNNTEMLMCGGGFRKIDFTKISASTIHKNISAFQNKTKDDKTRKTTGDRFIAAGKFRSFIEQSCISGAQQIQLGDLVRSAILSKSDSKAKVINNLWISNSLQNRELGPIIPLVDIGSSLEENNQMPLFNAIGVGIRISELTTSPFKNRILVFSASPQWLILEDMTFVDKAKVLYNALRGLNSNIEGALDMLKKVFITTESSEIKKLMLCIISDMQFETFKRKKCWPPKKQTLYELIKEKFEYNAPVCTLPKLIFYNVKQTTGMPLRMGEKDTYLLAGYNGKTLNVLNNSKKITHNYTCSSILQELKNKRYYSLEYFFNKIIK